MHTIANLVFALACAGTLLGGVALFWIARQDDARGGQILGAGAVLAAIAAALYLSAGHHWL